MTEEARATEKPTGLALLRVPFAAHHISKLPKPTKAQTEAVRNDFKKGIRCKLCGTWHHPDVVHLDYVGHAAATDRLLDADPQWNWEPVPDPAAQGLPVHEGCMWIKLTVCGVSRYGVGDADGKVGGNAIKEVIGDAIRNAGMRFGMALDLWHKGDLHADEEPAQPETLKEQLVESVAQAEFPEGPAKNITALKAATRQLWREISGTGDEDELNSLLWVAENKALLAQLEALTHPEHRTLWSGDGKDNPGISGLIDQKRNEFKNGE